MTVAAAAEPVSPSRLRLAIHEGGHLVMCVLLGRKSDGVTINVDGGGVAFVAPEPFGPNTALSGSLLLLGRDVRDRAEDAIVVTLAGPISEELWSPPDTGYHAEPASVRERDRLRGELERSGLQQRITEYEATPPLERQSDRDVVSKLSLMWTGSEQAATHYIAWLFAETVALGQSRDFSRPLAAVTRALLTHGTLSGEEVHRLVDEHTYPWARRADGLSFPFTVRAAQ